MLKLSEWGDKISAHPVFLAAFNVILVVAWLLAGTDVANICISIVTAEMVLLAAGANRRSFLALHAKLDEIIHALPDARDELVHLEDKCEAEIIRERI